MEKTIVKECLYCKQEFDAKLKEHKRGNALFCNLKCAAKFRNSNKPLKNCTCTFCNTEFKSVNPKAKYCSKECKYKYYRHSIYTNEGLTKRFQVILKSHPCMRCGWSEGPRDIHHILPVSEGGKNLLSNLICLCPNCHRLAHRNLLSKENLFEILENWTISSSSVSEETDALAGN